MRQPLTHSQKLSLRTLALSATLVSTASLADWSATVTGASDYMFNGVSQTNNDPALQGSIDYAADSGWYAGSWSSNVDYGDSADVELDFYSGYYTSLTDSVDGDFGIAYYSYHGGDDSSALNYPEVYAKLFYTNSLGVSETSFWYSWDYFGTGAGHVIGQVAHTYSLAENHAIRASIDVSHSLDKEKYEWDTDDATYVHYRLAYQTSFSGFDFELAAEDTTLSYDTADARLFASISRTFQF